MNTMKSNIKKFVKTLFGINNSASLLRSGKFNFSGESTYHIKNFGNQNPGLVFYVIAKSPGSGFFSNISYVINHLKIADNLGFIPVVDMENFPNIYNEVDSNSLPYSIKGKDNSWEYYFYPVSTFKLSDVYQSQSVVLTDGNWPENMTMSITSEPDLNSIYSKYVRVNKDILELVDVFAEQYFSGHKVLGIQFRGQEMRTAAGHSFPPSPKQMLSKAKSMIATHGFNRIFLVTEEQSYLELFKSEFGSMVLSRESYKTYNKNAFKIYPRTNHRFLLGRDVLVDALLLSKSNGLLCGDSNVSEFARFIGGEPAVFFQFNNGVNSKNPIVSKYLWFFKKFIPKSLGGFNNI